MSGLARWMAGVDCRVSSMLFAMLFAVLFADSSRLQNELAHVQKFFTPKLIKYESQNFIVSNGRRPNLLFKLILQN